MLGTTVMNSLQQPRILLVDGHNLLWRAAFGFPARINDRLGADVTPVFGFFALLVSGFRELMDGAEIFVCFDGERGRSHRQGIEESYKSGRESVVVEHLRFLPLIKTGLDTIGVPWYEDIQCEADDLIASLAKSLDRHNILILSTDKDFYQLLDDKTYLLDTRRKSSKRLIDVSYVKERFGVEPRQWCDFRALMGDPADDIPGLKGVGPKTASRLLSGGLTLEDLDESGRLTGLLGVRIREAKEGIIKTRTLLRLQDNLSLEGLPLPRFFYSLPPAAEIMKGLQLW